MFKVEVDPENLEVIARKIEKGVVFRVICKVLD